MADFCKQCSIKLFGEDCRDLAKGEDERKLNHWEIVLGYGWSVLCEGCGFILVDDDGGCISFNCIRKHNVKA